MHIQIDLENWRIMVKLTTLNPKSGQCRYDVDNSDLTRRTSNTTPIAKLMVLAPNIPIILSRCPSDKGC
ncbi:MAG: hypothetical protein R3E08_05495 [Thiotrichaceae bacterium]